MVESKQETTPIRWLLTIAWISFLVTFLGWAGLFIYHELVVSLFTATASRGNVASFGLWFLYFTVPELLALRYLGRMRGAAKRLDISGLKKLTLGTRFIFAVLAAIAVPGAALLAVRPFDDTSWVIIALLAVLVVPGGAVILVRPRVQRLSTPVVPPSDYVLSVEHLTKYFPIRKTFSQSLGRASGGFVHAVDDVTFGVRKGQVFGLAGESGSGKTTIIRTAMMLTEPTSGSIFFDGSEISRLSKEGIKKVRPKIQVVFQDPYESVNPRMTIFDIVAEGLLVNNLVGSREEALEKVERALREVQIIPPEDYIYRFPHELSGGQRQRVAIARALVMDPDVILADEPVSMLDVSIRAEVINVLLSIRERRGIAILMVTHDLALSKDMVDELAIMYLGKIVETGPAEDLVRSPYHPYSHALTAAVPIPDPTAPKVRVLAKGEIPTNISPPSGCRFHPRCPFAQQVCADKEPMLEEVSPGRRVACHFWKEAHEAFEKGLDGPVMRNASS